MKVSELQKFSLTYDITVRSVIDQCLLFTYNYREKGERSIILDLRKNTAYDINPNIFVLAKGPDEDSIIGCSHKTAYLISRESQKCIQETSIEGYQPRLDVRENNTSLILFRNREKYHCQIIDILSKEVVGSFYQPEGFSLHRSRTTQNEISLRPHQLEPTEKSSTFVNYDIQNDSVKLGRFATENYYDFMGYALDLSVYFSLQTAEVVVVSPIGQLVQSFTLEGYNRKTMPMVGYAYFEGLIILVYMADNKPSLIKADPKTGDVASFDAQIPKSKFGKTISPGNLTFPVVDGKILFKDRYICLNSLKGGSISFPEKIKWADSTMTVFDNKIFIIKHFGFAQGTDTGFTLGAFEGSSLPEGSPIANFEDIDCC